MSTWTNILDLVYPTGSVYVAYTSTSPATRFGGTWTAITDRFLIGAGSSYAGGAWGGEATHTLSQEEMPWHKHTDNSRITWSSEDGEGIIYPGWSHATKIRVDSVTVETAAAGGGQAHNNMPPYIAVYMWRRTA